MKEIVEMTKQEALDKIKELENYIKQLDNNIGFEDDEIFLLSIEEYKKYKDFIPMMSCWWWLRSPGDYQIHAARVDYGGSVYYDGYSVSTDYGCVRPAIHTFKNAYDIGTKICVAGYTWIVVDKENGIAIAEMPIAIRRFDDKSNDYKTSEIRKWLLDWYKERYEYFGGSD